MSSIFSAYFLSPCLFYRPTISEVLLAPLFWTSSTRLSFLLDASDAFESMSRDPPDPILVELEEQSREVLGDGWMSRFDSRFIDSLGKYRKVRVFLSIFVVQYKS